MALLIEPSVNIWGECSSYREESILWVERAGRTCYRSEDNIVEGSGEVFVKNIMKRRHFSVIEHSNIVLATKNSQKHPWIALENAKNIFDSKYFNFHVEHDIVYIAGSWRAWIEWYETHHAGQKVIFDEFPDILHTQEYRIVNQKEVPRILKAITVEFVTNRAVTHELVRHRPASYSQESQRYVRYDGGMLFIKPPWYDKASNTLKYKFEAMCDETEYQYKELRRAGLRAEQARIVLTNAVATKIVMTAYVSEWKHVFNLRTSNAAWEDIRGPMIKTKLDFVKNGWLGEEE